MKLARRVNFILLPFIAGIFIIAAFISDSTSYDHQIRSTRIEIAQELEGIDRQLNYKINLQDSLVQQFINSHEFTNYITLPNLFITNAAEALLADQREQINKISSGLLSVRLIDHTGQTLFSAYDKTVLEDADQAKIPKQYQRWNTNKISSNNSNKTSFLYRSESNKLMLGRIETFNADFATSQTPNIKNMLFFLCISDVSNLETRALDLGNKFSNSQTTTFEIKSIKNDERLKPHRRMHLIDNSLHISHQHPLFNFSMNLSEELIAKALLPQRQQLSLLTIALIVFSYSALMILINRQIIKPITVLTERIRSGNTSTIELKQGNDEVSVLNNAYHSLLSNVSRLASYDSLTNLANRSNFQGYFSRSLSRHLKKNKPLAILYIDLDNFKQVNDHYGHETGDQLLIEFSTRLRESVRTSDSYTSMHDKSGIARLAGDEFALLLTDISGPEDAALVAKRLLRMFDSGFQVGAHRHNVKASIGIAITPTDGTDASELMRHADAAMYQAKLLGRNRYQFFTAEIAKNIQERMDIQKELEQAIQNQEFNLVYMPIYQARTLEIIGAEVLIRSSNKRLSECGPDKFIPIAESTGLIKKIDLWTIENAFEKLNEMKLSFYYGGVISINISSIELHNKDFVRQVSQLISRYNTPVNQIEFEITETSLVSHDKLSIETLTQLKNLGIKLALDDFGTGYTGFNQLINYPVDTLKIDRSFIKSFNERSDKDNTMLKIMVELAALYGLSTIAEGIETEEQLNYLTELGCEAMQGYYLSKPLSESDFIQVWKDHNLPLLID